VIKSPTVFIVGAGASVPFKFPTGRQLLRERKDQNAEVIRGMCANQISEDEANALHKALRHSEDNSIDALLEYRPDLEYAGKLVIASSLLGREQDCINTTARDDDWIQYLLSLMSEGSHGVDKFAAGNSVTFVTYNYDRLIEYKMTNHLRAKWRATDKELLKVLRRIPVIHLHGKLGTLTPGSRHVPFGALNSGPKSRGTEARMIVRAAQSIRIVHQVMTNDAAFLKARRALNKSNVVFFLGFGFGRENVRRLDFKNLPRTGVVYATRTNMTNQEYNKYFMDPLEAVKRNQIVGGGGPTITEEWDCLKLIREYVGALI
jgi:hypothetical protein